ncbi:hypothetical protein FJR03_04175 [Sulfurimonas marina]|uniref:Uncharacterized protein n=1 Tax=Sulfurimonas marina TaxID=2590551 RepID=A0A7M1AX84_9BACT|nr:hypothetical protein FJR03_04175 [Sulfurimonas marina]
MMIREVGIFISLLIFLAVVIHPDLLSNLSERFSLMYERENYFHPFIYTFIVYLLLSLLRYMVIKAIQVIRKITNH